MSNPKNEFENFFENPESASKYTQPDPQQVIQALAILTAQNKDWFKNGEIRLMILSTLHKLGDELTEMAKTKKVMMHPACAAFLMTLGDFIQATTDEYATDKERELFPVDEDEDEDEDE